MKYLIYAMPLTRGEDEILMDDHAAHSVSECPLPSLDDHLLKVGEYVSIRMSPFMLWFSVDRCHRTARESQKKKNFARRIRSATLGSNASEHSPIITVLQPHHCSSKYLDQSEA